MEERRRASSCGVAISIAPPASDLRASRSIPHSPKAWLADNAFSALTGLLVSQSSGPIPDVSQASVPAEGCAASPFAPRATGTPVDLGCTLPLMEGRKFLRRFKGAYHKDRPLVAWAMFLLMMFFWTLDSWTIQDNEISIGLRFHLIGGSLALTVLTSVLLILYFFFGIQLMIQYNLAFSWVISAAFLCVSVFQLLLRDELQPGSKDYAMLQIIRNYLLVLFLIVQMIYLLALFSLREIIPKLQQRGWLLTRPNLLNETPQDVARVAAAIPLDPRLRVVAPTGMLSSSTFEYVQGPIPLVPFLRTKYRLSYSGEVDRAGRPHGYGLWADNHWHGETLEGWWMHGEPIAPFRSRETGSGSGFVSLRIAYAHSRCEGLSAAALWPQNGPLKFGVASAECSVSGFFFRDFPMIKFLQGPGTVDDITGLPPRNHDGAQADGSLQRLPTARLKRAIQWLYQGLQPLEQQNPSSSVSVVITAGKRGLQPGGYYKREQPQLCKDRAMNQITVRAVENQGSQDNLSRYAMQSHSLQAMLGSSPAAPRMDNMMPRDSPDTGRRVAHRSPPEGKNQSRMICEGDPGDAGSSSGNTFREYSHPSLARLFSPGATAGLDTLLQLDGWAPCQHGNNPEALLYVHGFNSPVDWGIRALAQLLALGNFPAYLKPFVYSWPTGQVLSYHSAKRAAQSQETSQGYIDVIRGLDAAGFKRVHILTHSMGVRVLLASLPGLLEQMTSTPIQPAGGERMQAVGPEQDQLHLPNGLSISTITMMNPETGLKSFLQESLPILRTLCPIITIYGDVKDFAIQFAEAAIAFERLFMGPDNRRQHSVHRSNSSFLSRLQSGDFPLRSRSDAGYIALCQDPSYLEDAGPGEDPECCCGGTVWERSLGNHIYDIKGPFGQPEDIDVVDTTFLNANVHVTRHMFFSLNREFVEDLHDLVTTLRRAGQRPRLEPRGGNVYSFLVAPPFVKAD